MKKTKILSCLTSLLLASALIFSGCSNDDDEKSADQKSQPDSEQTDETKQTAVFDSVDDAAFTVLRSLTDLTQYDENKVTDDEDGTVSGIETLPEDWNTLKFPCDEGFVLDETKETVRSLPVNGFGEALEFFSSIIGESLTESSLTDGRYAWSYSGLGSLTFTKVTGDEDLFATLDVRLFVMPGLTQLRFISKDSAKKVLESSNKFYGDPYFHAGDVIRRNKDGTYWICVRPAGGPYYKDYSYWIALDAYDNTKKSIIKSEEKWITIFYSIDKNYQYQEFDQKWVYAKNLMTLKIAKAAFHTFSSLVNENTWNWEGYEHAREAYEALKGKGIDLLMLHRDIDGDLTFAKQQRTYSPGCFAFAYGSPKKDSNRSLKLNKNYATDDDFRFHEVVFKTAGQIQYVQPFVSGETDIEREEDDDVDRIKEYFSTVYTADVSYSDYKNKKFLLSITDSFDEVYLTTTHLSGTVFASIQGSSPEEKAENFYYNFQSYLHSLTNSNDTASPGPLGYVHPSCDSKDAVYMPETNNWHIIIAPELKLADNKGAKDGSKAVKPVKDKDYTEVYVQGNETYFDYWNSFSNCDRIIDAKKVDWQKENKE